MWKYMTSAFSITYQLHSNTAGGGRLTQDSFRPSKTYEEETAQSPPLSLRIQQSWVPADLSGANLSSWETTGSIGNVRNEEQRWRGKSVTRKVSRTHHDTEFLGLDCVWGAACLVGLERMSGQAHRSSSVLSSRSCSVSSPRDVPRSHWATVT